MKLAPAVLLAAAVALGGAAARGEEAPATRAHIDLVGGGSVEGRIVSIGAETIVVDGGAFQITLKRADVLAIDGRPLAAPPGSRPAHPETPPPPAGPVLRRGALHLALAPRLLVAQACTSTNFAGDCLESHTQVGYAVTAAFGIGAIVSGRLLLALEAAIGAAGTEGKSIFVLDLLAVARWMAIGGLFLELGAGVGMHDAKAGLALREGVGYELRLSRALVLAPVLSATELLGGTGLARFTAELQVALRYYF